MRAVFVYERARWRSGCLAGLGAAALFAGGASGATTAVGTVLLVVMNSASLDAQESAKKTMIEGWGYTVTPISAASLQAAFDTACQSASCAYISETVTSSDVGTKLTAATIPVINEEAALSDELGFAASMSTFTGTQVNITNTTHSITSTLLAGNLTIFPVGSPLRYLSGTQGSYRALGQQPATANVTFAVFERGDTTCTATTVAGRRVFLPWGNTGVDITTLNASGQTIMKRSIEWALAPIARWKLDDASGSSATDSEGGHTGNIVGGTWTTGRITGGLGLNGGSDSVTIADHAAFHVTNALTVAGWIKGNSWPADANWASTVLRKGDANPCNWQLAVVQGQVKLMLDDYDAYGIAGGTVLALNKWNHVAATWDGTNVRIYANGVLDATPTARAAPIGTDTRVVYLGGRPGSTDVTNGVVDDVRFYNRALTAAEIAALAKATPTLTSWESVAP